MAFCRSRRIHYIQQKQIKKEADKSSIPFLVN